MKVIVGVTGVRGSGKTTLVRKLSQFPGVRSIRATTTRPKRDSDSDEYRFLNEDGWLQVQFAWEFGLGDYRYGVQISEIDSFLADPLAKIGILAFHPSYLDYLKKLDGPSIQSLIVGLDTIEDSSTQSVRVAEEEGRAQDGAEITEERANVRGKSDVVLTGPENTVSEAGKAILTILMSNGAVLSRQQIEPLVQAEALLSNGRLSQCKPASYDLRIGDEVWTRGEAKELVRGSDIIEIPPYSYVIVKAAEVANLPTFISGRFDLKLSLFFRGAILSNGPQVDPGYKGALFCMIFNASDDSLFLAKGEHFATLEFVKVVGKSVYDGQYQDRRELSSFMKPEYIRRTGGTIESRLKKQHQNIRRHIWFIATAFGAPLLGLFVSFFFYIMPTSLEMIDRHYEMLDELQEAQTTIEKGLEQDERDRRSGLEKGDEGESELN